MSISLLAAAGISAALSSLGAWGSSKLSNISNKSMLNRQFQNDVKMWNMQNEYNLPKNQMQRYQDAGLNPNLIYGEGSASAGNASGYPSFGFTRQDYDLGNPGQVAFSDAMQAIQLKQSLKESNSRIAANQANATFTEGLKSDATRQSISNMATTQDVMKSTISKNLASMGLTNFNIQKGKTLLPYQTSAQDALINKTLKESALVEGKTNLLNNQRQLINAGIMLAATRTQALRYGFPQLQLESELGKAGILSKGGWAKSLLSFILHNGSAPTAESGIITNAIAPPSFKTNKNPKSSHTPFFDTITGQRLY